MSIPHIRERLEIVTQLKSSVLLVNMATATQTNVMPGTNSSNNHSNIKSETGAWKEKLDLPQKDNRVKTAVSVPIPTD